MPDLTPLYGRVIPEGSLVFDIGAHIGDMTALFLGLASRVVAVEPLPEMAERLRSRFGSCVQVVEAAVAEEEGTAELHWQAGFSGLATLYPEVWYAPGTRFKALRPDHCQVVPLVTLDSLMARYGRPAFIKIDVEGGELPVLYGLSKPVPALSFEYAREHLPAAEACCVRLVHLGYRYFTCTAGEGPDLCVPWGPASGVLGYITLKHQPEWGNVFARLEAA